ncbi:HMG box protein [Nannizzia gypsea CBS 118893]|uniref:HMG box protein n=1 Tax=Arthroderma gypseum (strain ATCC MYA-4604 / CBS 118893) TaxID=535722 RepID=E4UU21_ARTGP|nr:HMG box protein [Nannizzia gypsea CBS 118893]EFR01611.1 HMG box protein [Nannizzia gypsea CBS 118893]
MFNQQPPSPPPSNDGDVKLSPQALSQTSFQQHQQQLQQQYHQTYSHNQPQQLQQFGYISTREPYSYNCLEVRTPTMSGPMQNGYESNTMYHSMARGEHETSLPALTYHRAGEMPVPATVSAGETVEDLKEELAVAKSNTDERVRIIRPAKLRRRPKPAKTDKGDGPTIDAPLSELTKNMAHIPIRDMGAWVNRPKEARLEEVRVKNGKIARPMNSFMLYRSAYAERTKEWCAQNNHQVVSRASGQSWPLEPREIRDLYEQYATIERDNHHKAHPDYKFAPNKNQGTPKSQNGGKAPGSASKRKRSHEEELSDLEDQPLDITSYPRIPNRRRTLGLNGDASNSRNSTPCDNDSTYDSRNCTPIPHSQFDMYAGGDANRSSWEMINPGRPHPGIISQPEQPHYYQPSIHQSLLGSNIEDVTYKKIGMPGGVTYDNTPQMANIPGTIHQDILQSQPLPQNRMSVSMGEVQVDPQLLDFEPTSTSLPIDTGNAFGNQNDFWQFNPPNNQNYVHGYMSAPESEQYNQASLPPSSMATGIAADRVIWANTHTVPGEEFTEWFSGSTVN